MLCTQGTVLVCGDDVTSVAWSPDSTKIAAGVSSGCVYVWAASSGICAYILRRHSKAVSCVAWSPDSRELVSGSTDCSVRLWSLNSVSKQCIHVQCSSGSVTCVAWMRDTTRYAFGTYGSVEVRDSITGIHVCGFNVHRSGTVIALSSASCTTTPSALVAMTAEGELSVWSEHAGLIQSSKIESELVATLYATTRASILSGTLGCVAWTDSAGQLVVELSGSRLSCASIFPDAIQCIAWSNDGQHIATGTRYGYVLIWDAKTGKIMRRIKSPCLCVKAIAWSPDGTRIATASDRKIYIWTVCNWSDKRNKLFGEAVRHKVFYLMCVRNRMLRDAAPKIPMLPMEMWLEVFAALAYAHGV